MLIKIPRPWEIPEREATPEGVYLNRRQFLRAAGLGTAGAILGCGGNEADSRPAVPVEKTQGPGARLPNLYPARRSARYALDRPLTKESVAAMYNNFYEFSTDKEAVKRLVERFEIHPWQVEVTGLVARPKVYDLDDLVKKMPVEERLYRFRCVEAWAMAVPWTGFPFKALIDEVQPTSRATHIRLVSFYKPDQAPGIRSQSWYNWPYHEGLTVQEAMNELTMLIVGIYGHDLPRQHGAPIRLVTPWKYGYKSIKSVVQIEFVDGQPPTFWNEVAPDEYDFWSNVNPGVPHPRWSQASERMIDTGERRPTLLYNGYGDHVRHLYKS